MTDEFGGQFTVFPDTGTVELHCYKCSERWQVAYHPSLDVLIEQARSHLCPARENEDWLTETMAEAEHTYRELPEYARPIVVPPETLPSWERDLLEGRIGKGPREDAPDDGGFLSCTSR